jgi:hypothetical protein
MKNGKLFRETYVNHAKVEGSGGFYWTELMIKSVQSQFGLTDSEMRRVLAGATADGQYIKCNMDTHLASILHLPRFFTASITTWDYNHQTERGDHHARIKNMWVNISDDKMKEVMKANNTGNNRTELLKICKENDITFFEFVLPRWIP